jgi:poly(3-hydroxybutyrate) depolymerase
MNGSRHATAFANLFTDLIAQKHAEAAKTEEFDREYFAVLDLAGEFYLETVQLVFHEQRLARGEPCWRGQIVDPAAIRRTVLLTVEGERDDICGIGQTAAAQDLCNKIPLARRSHHLQADAGHYGVFSGRRWEREVYPVVRNAILTGERRPRVAARQPARTGVQARGTSPRASRVG